MTEDQIKECTEEFHNGLGALHDAVEKGTVSPKVEAIFIEALLNCLRAAARDDVWRIEYDAPNKDALFHISGIEPTASEGSVMHETSCNPVKLKKKPMTNKQVKSYEEEFSLAIKRIQKACNKRKIEPDYAHHLTGSVLMLLKYGVDHEDWEIGYNMHQSLPDSNSTDPKADADAK